MTTVDEMAEFVVLRDRVQNIPFAQWPDAITWRWTADDAYTSASAYLAQFTSSSHGSLPFKQLVCSLCDQEQETAVHLCLYCVFAREVWVHMNSWSAGLIQVPDAGMTIEGWWQNSLGPFPKEQRRNVAALLMYASWNIWKERN